MNSFWKRLRSQPVLSSRDWVLTLLPLLLWGVLFLVRPHVSHLECGHQPSACSPESLLLSVDRFSIKQNSQEADVWSDLTQNASGALALIVPAIYVLRSVNPVGAWSMITTDVILGLQATFLNGALNEVVRLSVQRPRPFVYRDPVGSGFAPMNYTSFYSGHTSFSALACMILMTTLLGRGASRRWIWASGLSAVVLVSVSAYGA